MPLLLLLALSASAQTFAPPIALPLIETAMPADTEALAIHAGKYRARAEQLAAEGADFSRIYQSVCGLMVERAASSFNPMSEGRSLFLGLVDWTRNGGRPRFQGREDLALHFIYGGYISSWLGETMAEKAAYERERRNAHEAGNSFDLDDYAATVVGSKWAARLSAGFFPWAEPWASGERSLATLTPLRLGRLPHGVLADDAQLEDARRAASDLLR